jgi:large subunit ribosomal protein L24
MKTHVKKGDMVVVISGDGRMRKDDTGKYVGRSGKILAVFPRKQQVIVEGCNIVRKHLRKSQDHPKGAIVEREAPIHISNVMLKEKWDKRHAAPARAETLKE